MRKNCCSNFCSTTASAGPLRINSIWVILLVPVLFRLNGRVYSSFMFLHLMMYFLRSVTVVILSGRRLHRRLRRNKNCQEDEALICDLMIMTMNMRITVLHNTGGIYPHTEWFLSSGSESNLKDIVWTAPTWVNEWSIFVDCSVSLFYDAKFISFNACLHVITAVARNVFRFSLKILIERWSNFFITPGKCTSMQLIRWFCCWVWVWFIIYI